MSRQHDRVGRKSQSAFRWAVAVNAGFRCQGECGRLLPMNQGNAHHVVALELGGQHDPKNGKWLCVAEHIAAHRPAVPPERAAWDVLVRELATKGPRPFRENGDLIGLYLTRCQGGFLNFYRSCVSFMMEQWYPAVATNTS